MSGLKEKIKPIAIGVSIVTLVIGGLIGGLIEGGATASAYSGDWSSYTDLGDYIVKTDEEGAMPALTKEQLKTAIDKSYTGGAHDNYIAEINSFISMQNKYKVNAAFAVAVAQTESTGGTNWDYISKETYNWYSISGSVGGGYVDKNGTSWNKYESFADANDGFGSLLSNNYFTQDKITVDTVGTIYCNPPTAWSNSVKGLLDKMYSAVAETLPSSDGEVQAGEGDGYFKIYKNGNRKYKLYEQWTGSYSGNSYGGSTIAGYGCGPSCVAIISTGYGIDKNPGQIVSECSSITNANGAGTVSSVIRYLNKYGLEGKHVGHGSYVFTQSDKTQIINHLKSGNPVILLIHRPVVLNDGSTSTTTDHWITLLGVNNKNDIFVGDPGNAYTDGETTIDSLCNKSGATNYILVSK